MTPSLRDVVDDPGDLSEDELMAAHAAQLRDVIQTVGVETAAVAADGPRDAIAEIAEGDVEAAGDLDLEAAAAILALADGAPPADEQVDEALDALLFGMTAGVLNVDVVAGELALDVEPREVQGMLEGRHPLTLREYAALQHVIASRTR